jgi:hypothetical protein
LIDIPLKVATPLDADTGVVPFNAPGPPLVGVAGVIASAMDAELPVTVFPPASCTVTTGCVAQAIPPVPPPGCVVNASFAAGPTVMLKAPLVALVNAPSVAANV